MPTSDRPGPFAGAGAVTMTRVERRVDTESNVGGRTDIDTLEPECRHHHRLRHETVWMPTRDAPTGVVTWRSPRGHETEPAPPPF